MKHCEMCEMCVVSLIIEKSLTCALICIISEPDEGEVHLDVAITPTSLLMRTPDGCSESRLPAEVRLVPSSCGGLQYISGDGLHLRLQACTESSPRE